MNDSSPHPPEDIWTWTAADDAFEHWDEWARRTVPEAVQSGRRGQRHSNVPGPDGRDVFVKQYHHGGLLAGEEDVFYETDGPFRSELNCTVQARKANLPVPRPIGILTHKSDRGTRGWYVSDHVSGTPFSRLLRNADRRTGLAEQAGILLARLHQAGLDHRDYQVKNLLVTDDEGDLLVLDFAPCRTETPGTFGRAHRLLRFRRSLTKYGINGGTWRAFLDGYREESGSDLPAVRRALRPFTGLKHAAGNLAYTLNGRPLEPIDLEKILIRGPNWVGDAVMSLPSIQSLRDQHPEAVLDVVVRSGLADVYRASPAVRRVHTLPEKSWRWPDEIRRERYSAAVILPKSFRTGVQAWTSGIPRRVGFGTQGRRWTLTDPVPLDGQDRTVHHARLHYRAMGRLVEEPERLPEPKLKLASGVRQAARSLVDPPYVCFHPGAAYGPAKRWPAEPFAEALDRLIDKQHGTVVAIGVEEERDLANPIINKLDRSRVLNLVGQTTLNECMGVLEGASGVLANDSGIMHLAAGLDTPTLGIFGSTDPELTSPCGPRTLVAYEGVSCSPCFERRCPLEEDRYKCLTRFDPRAVAEQLLILMEKPENPESLSDRFSRVRP